MKLLESGRFAHVPHLYGTNSDEGTDNAPVGAINSDEDLYKYLLTGVGFGYTASAIDEIMQLYPDDPAQGKPPLREVSFATWRLVYPAYMLTVLQVYHWIQETNGSQILAINISALLL